MTGATTSGRRHGAPSKIGLMVAAIAVGIGCGDGGNIDWAAHNWPVFGHDQRNTRYQSGEVEIGSGNVTELEEKWRWPEGDELGPGVTSTPIVADGELYFGTWQSKVVALNARNGNPVWESPSLSGAVDATPLVTENRVYVSDGGGSLSALDRDSGEVLWSESLDDDPLTHLYSSPVHVADANQIVIGVASLEVIGSADMFDFRGSVVGLDADTGEELWRVYLTNDDETSGAGVSVWSSAAVDEERDLIFIGTGQNVEAPASEFSDALIAINYQTGEMEWSRQFTADDVFTILGDLDGPDYDVGASPNLFMIGDQAVVGVADKRGVYSTLDRETGETVWATMLTPGSHLGGVMATAAYHEGTIYVVSNDLSDSSNYNADANFSIMFALDAATGDIEWQTEIPSAVFGAVSMANGVVYTGTVNGEVRGLDAATGDIVWSVDGLQDIGGGTSIAAGRVYVPHGFEFFSVPTSAEGGLVVYGLP